MGKRGWALLVAAMSGEDPTLASFSGANDKIAWTSVVDVGTPEARTAIVVDTVPLTHPVPGENHSDPSWSADGEKLVFISNSLAGNAVEVVNKDGSGRRVVINTTLLGLPPASSPVWQRNGTTISFRITQFTENANRIYTVGSDGTGLFSSIAGAVSEFDWSSLGQLVYRFQNPLFPETNRLVISSSPNLFIDIPGQLGMPTIHSPAWMPDGDTVVFRAVYSLLEYGTVSQRSEWFKIRRDGSGLKQLTKARDICPAPGLQPDFSLASAAPSPDGDLIVLQGTQSTVESFNGTSCTFRGTKGLWSIPSGGGNPRLVHEDSHASGRPSWQPNPASLVVKVDDGRNNPLEGLKIEIFDATAPPGSGPVVVEVERGHGGSYGFDLPFGSYRVRATLWEDLPDVTSAFEVRHREVPGEAVWLEKTILHQLGMPQATLSFDPAATGASNVPSTVREHLDDMANIYYRIKQFVDWTRSHLTPDTGEHVTVRTFATHRTNGNPLPPLLASYTVNLQTLSIGTLASEYANRDGSAQAMAPENGEWHEFTHHLYAQFVRLDCPDTTTNHHGYLNPDTCDSVSEGFAEFLPTLAAQAIDGATDADYDSRFDSIERDFLAWETSATGKQREEFAVASLFWDLVDAQADDEGSKVIGTDGLHHDVTYQDTMSITLGELWNRLTTMDATGVTVADLRLSFGTVAPTRDLDGDGMADVAPIDEVFLMHGFYPVQGDQQQTPAHKGYHFNVTQRDQIGLSTHDVLDAAGNTTQVGNTRLSADFDPGANLEVSVRDASGTPLEGATIRLTLDDTTPPRTVERALHGGEAALVGLELPPYFSYMLPSDAPGLPPCDPANDRTVEVVVTASLNGYDSPDSFTFDNCAYWHAIEDATGPAAMSFTMTFPEDATPPVSTIYALASVQPTAGGTTGYWTLELSCSDPVAGAFASGCHRTEYRINGGPLTPYTRKVELVGVGQYVVQFRSLDAAANAEDFQSITYNVIVPPDADGDGLSDAEELARGTNPNNPDTDGDGLQDGAEVSLGTNPLSGDSDGDGLSDSNEVGLGTNPTLSDTDADGLTDGAEVAAGYDPLVADMDGDRDLDGADNCPTAANAAQHDSDGDGVGELCDVCPGAADAGQADSDDDGAGDACDCAPADPLVRAPASPSLVASKTGGSTLVLTWAPVAGADDYSVTAGTRAGLAAGDFGACAASTGGLTTFQSTQVPAPGELLTFLVQGQSYPCGMGSLGFGIGETRRTNTHPLACQPAVVVDRRSLSGTVILGDAGESHTVTHAADGVYLQILQTLTSGGNPSSRFTRLEYRFTFDVASGHQKRLLVKGMRLGGFENFRFEWSTDGTTFTPISMDSLPLEQDDGVFRVGELPPALTGNVILRVVDTDRTPGSQWFDWLRIDSLLVRSISP